MTANGIAVARAAPEASPSWSKVPSATLGFWLVKICATTLGETGGDTVTMTLEWSYLAATMLFLGLAYRACDYANSRRQSRRQGASRIVTGNTR